MKKLFYPTLLLVLIASLTGLAIATALQPSEPLAPVRSLVLPAPLAPAS